MHLSWLQPGSSARIYGLLTRPNSPGSRADEPGSQATPSHHSRAEQSNLARARPGHRLPSAPRICRRRHSHGLLETPDNLAGFGGYLSLSLFPLEAPAVLGPFRLPSPASSPTQCSPNICNSSPANPRLRPLLLQRGTWRLSRLASLRTSHCQTPVGQPLRSTGSPGGTKGPGGRCCARAWLGFRLLPLTLKQEQSAKSCCDAEDPHHPGAAGPGAGKRLRGGDRGGGCPGRSGCGCRGFWGPRCCRRGDRLRREEPQVPPAAPASPAPGIPVVGRRSSRWRSRAERGVSGVGG